MVFAVIETGFKSDLMLGEGSTETDRYIPNLDHLSFIEALDAVRGLDLPAGRCPAYASQRVLD
jgi:hypothetical protein